MVIYANRRSALASVSYCEVRRSVVHFILQLQRKNFIAFHSHGAVKKVLYDATDN